MHHQILQKTHANVQVWNQRLRSVWVNHVGFAINQWNLTTNAQEVSQQDIRNHSQNINQYLGRAMGIDWFKVQSNQIPAQEHRPVYRKREWNLADLQQNPFDLRRNWKNDGLEQTDDQTGHWKPVSV